MRVFKILDLGGQFLIYLFTVFLGIEALVHRYNTDSQPSDGYWVAIPYVLMGFWQPVSAVIHLFFNGYFLRAKLRTRYWQSLLILLVVFVIPSAYFPDWSLGVMILAPFIAILYTIACYREYKLLEERRFIHLK